MKPSEIKPVKLVSLVITEGELEALSDVVDKDLYDLLDGWQHLSETDPEAWEKKKRDMSSVKSKVIQRFEEVRKAGLK